MREIDHHAERVHLPHQLHAKSSQTHAISRLQAAVRGATADVMRESQRAHPQRVQGVQHIQALFRHIRMLDVQDHRRPPTDQRPLQVRRAPDDHSIRRLLHQVAQQESQRVHRVGQMAIVRLGDVHRKEPCIETRLAHALQVDLHRLAPIQRPQMPVRARDKTVALATVAFTPLHQAGVSQSLVRHKRVVVEIDHRKPSQKLSRIHHHPLCSSQITV